MACAPPAATTPTAPAIAPTASRRVILNLFILSLLRRRAAGLGFRNVAVFPPSPGTRKRGFKSPFGVIVLRTNRAFVGSLAARLGGVKCELWLFGALEEVRVDFGGAHV